jgi:hydrophobe/amphiphile efflux-3 (HAE3) family protein
VVDVQPQRSPMQRFWSWLAVVLGKHIGIVSLIGLLVTLVLGYGLTRLEFATGQDSYLNTDEEVYIDNVAYQDLFGGQAMLVMLEAQDGSIGDAMTASNLAEFDRIAEELKARPDLVASVVTPTTALLWSQNLVSQQPDGTPATSPLTSATGLATAHALEVDPSEEGRALRQADATETLARFEAVPPEQRSLDAADNQAWVDLLLYDNQGDIRRAQQAVFTDDQHAFIIVRLVGNASIEIEGEGSTLVRDVVDGSVDSGALEGLDAVVTGAPILLKDINDYLRGGMLQLGGIALVIMAIILLLLFDVRWRLLPLGVIIVGVIWAFGLAGYLGIPLSLVTIAGLPILLGIGIDYAIQMHARIEEEVVVDRDPHPIQETSRSLGPALVAVAIAGVVAMAALSFAEVPMIRAFGLLLAVGLAVVCLVSLVLPLGILGAREYRSPTKRKDYREGWISRFVVWLGSLPLSIAPVFVVFSIFVFAGGLVVEERLKLQTDVLEWVNQESKGILDFRTVEAETGSSSELGIFIYSPPLDERPTTATSAEQYDVFSQETVTFTWEYAEQLRLDHPEALLTASSLVTTIGYATEVPGATPVTPRAEDVVAGYDLAPEDIQVSTIALPSDETPNGAANLIYRYAPSSLEERKEVVNDIRAETAEIDAIESGAIRAVPSGLAIVGVGLLENLKANRILLTYLALGFVAAWLAIRMRSVVRSLLAMVPVLIAVGGTSIVAYAFGLTLSPMTAVGGPLVTAACTEFTSLMLFRFLEERRRGLWPRQASDVASARTGRAFVVSALTTMTGVAVIATSSLPLLRDFGIVVATNVTVALLAALIVLPPLLVWADARGWVSKGQVPRDVLERTTPKLAGRTEAEAVTDERSVTAPT